MDELRGERFCETSTHTFSIWLEVKRRAASLEFNLNKSQIVLSTSREQGDSPQGCCNREVACKLSNRPSLG